MASEPQVDETDAQALPEVAADSKQEEAGAPETAITQSEQEPTTGSAATADAAEGTNGVTAGDEIVVDEVIDAADDFGASRVVGRESSENGNDDEPSGRRGRRGRSRTRSRSRSRSRSRDRIGAGANDDISRDRGRRRDEDRERERERDRSRGRDRDTLNGRDTRDRGRDDSRDRNRGNDARDRDRGRQSSRDKDRGRGPSRDRDWGRDERDRMRGRDRDSFENTRDRSRQGGGQGQGRRDRGPISPMDGGRAGRDHFRGRGPPSNGPMMQPMGGNMPMMQPMGMPGAPMFPPQAAAHGQMVFSTTQRPQPKMIGGQQTRTYNILPMISFKAFMAEQRDDVTPEECKQRYDEYKADYVQRLTLSFFDVHRKEEWFLDRYHPKNEELSRNTKLKWIDSESALFGRQLRSNPRQFIASASLDPISEEQRWGGVEKRKKHPRSSSREDAAVDAMDQDSEHLGDADAKNEDEPENDVDAKDFPAHANKVAFIRRIPAWVSTTELGRQIVTEAPKHERIVCSDAANTRNEDFARSAFIIYKTPEKAAKAVQKLNKMRIYQTPRPKSKVGKKLSNGEGKSFELKVFAYQPRSHTSVEHEFSSASRIVEDTKLSLKVAEALDKEFHRTDSADGIAALLAEPEVQAALASSPAGTSQLDLVCAYMKRVYLYLYYRGQQCRDEGDMIASRGAGRAIPSASKEEIEEAMRKADSMSQDNAMDVVSGNGTSGSGEKSADKGEMGQTNRTRGSGVELVDNVSAARIEQAEKAEEKLGNAQAFIERYDSRLKEEVSKWQALNTGRTDEGYARCGMAKCAKLFKAPEFVHKHLVNKHPEKHKIVVDKVSEPFVREMFMADENKPLPNIVADANTPPVVLLPGAMAMGGAGAMPQGPPPMGGPGFPMMGGGMPMGPMGPMMPPGQMGGMGEFPMQMPIPPDPGMSSAGRGFRGRGGGGFRGRGGAGGRFGGRGMGRMDSRPEPIGPRDPRSLVSYVDVDAPKETTPNLDYGEAFPSKSKKKRRTM